MAKRKRKKSRRARGTGSVYHDDVRDVWVVKRIVGKTASGKIKYLQRSAATLAEANAKLSAAGLPDTRTTYTVAEWSARWLAAGQVRKRTQAIRSNNFTIHINPILGGVSLSLLSVLQIETAIAQWIAKKLAPNTIRQICADLSTCLGAAVRAGLLTTNPAMVAKRPRGTRPKVTPFTVAELQRIIEASADRATTRVFALVAGVGCRIGEALALEVTDFNNERETISITRTMAKDKTVGPTKTETGNRTIAPPLISLPAMRAAIAGRSSGPMFATVGGAHISPTNAQKYWEGLLKRLNLPYRNMHQMRHSVATVHISNSVPPGDVAAYLGDRVETIVKTYLHPTGINPALTMNRLFSASSTIGSV